MAAQPAGSRWHAKPLTNLQQELRLIACRSELAQATLDRFKEISKLIDRHVDSVSRIYFDGSTGPKAPDAELFIERPDGSVELYEGFAASAAAFAHSPEEFNYVFYSGKSEAAPLVHIAVELVLFDRYGLTYGRGSADHAKINFDDVATLKRLIEERSPDFFLRRAQLRPRNAYARHASRVSEVDKIYNLTKTFQKGITRESILKFLDQFPEAVVPAAIKMLSGVQFVDDATAAQEVKRLLAGMNGSMPLLVPLTRYGESSSVMAYHLRQNGTTPTPLEQAFEQRASNIVLFEDSVLSGKQACSILLSWFGKEAPSPDDEAQPLSDEMLAWLSGTEIGFAFNVGAEKGVKALEACAVELGLKLRRNKDGTAVVLLAMGASKRLADLTLSKTELQPLQNFLGAVGESVLTSTKMKVNPQKWTLARCKERALGYSADAGLTIFKNNSPTSTLTALWCEGGTFRNVHWIPLFPRKDPDGFIGPPAPVTP